MNPPARSYSAPGRVRGAVTQSPLGIAIIGCGRISRSHAAAIAACPEVARVLAVVDRDCARAHALAHEFGVAQVCDTLEAALRMPGVDAVIICTPNSMHAEQSIVALEAGVHVLVEKPMADHSADAARMSRTAEFAGRVLAIGHTFRHSDPIRYVQDHRAEFGRLRAVEVSMCVHWPGPQAPWWATRSAREGLILALFAPHALDFVQLALGDADPLSVHCEAARHQSGWQGEDEAMILLRYPAGCLASVHVSYNQSFIVDRKTLHYERAFVRIENAQELWIDDRAIMLPADGGEAVHSMGQSDLGDFFRRQLSEFVAAVRGEPNRSVLHAEGLRMAQLLDRVISHGADSLARG